MQVNARKIYDEPNVLEGIASNRLFLGILGAEFALQVRILHAASCTANVYVCRKANGLYGSY